MKWYRVQYKIDVMIKADEPLDALVEAQECASEGLGMDMDQIVWKASKEEIKEHTDEGNE